MVICGFDVDLVLFDYNGTLQDDAPLTYQASPLAIMRHFGLPEIGYESWRMWENHHDWDRIYRSLGVPDSVTHDELNAIYIGALRVLPDAPLFPDAVPTLQRLADAGVRQALVSGMPEALLAADLERHGIRRFFERVDGGVRLKAQVFAGAAADLGVPPERVLCVGDISDDAVAADWAGQAAVVIPRGFQHPDSVDDAFVRLRLPQARILPTLAALFG